MKNEPQLMASGREESPRERREAHVPGSIYMAPVTEDEAAAAAERIFERLAESGGLLQQHDHQLQRQLRLHFRRMPARYLVDMCGGKAEEVLIHLQLLADCADPANRPVVHARFLLTIPSSSSSSIVRYVRAPVYMPHYYLFFFLKKKKKTPGFMV